MSRRNSTIGGKLVFASVLLLLGFVVIGFTYNQSITIKEQILAQTKALNKFQLLAKEANLLLVSAQRIEAEFKARKNVALVKKHLAQVKKIYRLLDQMTRLAPGAHERSMLRSLRNALKKYETAFKREVVAIIEIGLNDRTGLLGSLEYSLSKVEKAVRSTGNVQLLKVVLEIRHLEKNFLLHSNKADLRKLFKNAELLSTLVSRSQLRPALKKQLLYNIKRYRSSLTEIRFAIEDRNEDARVLAQDTRDMEQRLNEMLQRISDNIAANKLKSDQRVKNINKISLTIVLGISTIVSLLFINLTGSITRSLKRLRGTIQRISMGDYSARTNMKTRDELGELGRNFDKMLDERVTRMAHAEQENEALNNSIMELLETVSALSSKDLTVTVPVAEDITGAVGDAINLLANETADVLNSIRQVAQKVDQTAAVVRTQSDKVSGVAENERKVLGHTVAKLEHAAKKMNAIASHAQNCNRLADETTETTELALRKVNNAVTGMAEIRETISETEKRIKRLGERSQEITKVVEIISNIAERTHVLALNASMQAAAAGESGRGFAVVADEVQRLAESSQSETAHISELVNSIQLETSGAIVAINKAISQVVKGSELAGEAGKQMVDVQETTSKLVSAVADIAKASVVQAKINNEISHSAVVVQKSTEATREELKEQAQQTKNLVVFAENMLKKVNQFKLPSA